MNMSIRQESKPNLQTSRRISNLRTGLEGLQDLGRNLDQLEGYLAQLAEASGKNTGKAVQRLRSELAGFEPTVTVLGQVKSGKTTLVNAMAGWADLLPSDVNPWTSVVTSLHLKPATHPIQNGASFQFMTAENWDRLLSQGGRIGEMASRAGAESELARIGKQVEAVRAKAQNRLGQKFDLLLGETHDYGYFDKNLLERYIVLGDDFGEDDSDQGRFADILSSADLNLNSETVPIPLCLRDTPGVNDTFMMREQVTIQALRSSKICVVVLSAGQALTSVDMGLVRLISNLKSRDVLIFVNRIDELSDPINQIPEIEASIRKTLRERQGPVGVDILFGSAYWANKALTGNIENMPEASSKALLAWAEVALDPQSGANQPHEVVWELSGMSRLYHALSERVIQEQGQQLVEETAQAALTIATSELAAGMVQIDASAAAQDAAARDAVVQDFRALEAFHQKAFDEELAAAIAEFHIRADRAHAKFIDRALRSLLTHLENHGKHIVWDYDPVGLRMLLRSAYSAFGAKVRSLSKERFQAAMTDVAMLYARAYGSAVEGIQMAPPGLPEIPAPVALGQTIALDFNDGWWISWWTRIRGFNAFAKRFQNLIARETEDFMTQVKGVQTSQLRDMAQSNLQGFFAQHAAILQEIGTGSGAEDVDAIFHNTQDGQKKAQMQALIAEFESLLARSETRAEGTGQ
jgi:hypothetical protein